MKTKLASWSYGAAALLLPLLFLPHAAYPQAYGYPDVQSSPAPGIPWKMRILSLLMGALLGGLIGAFFSDKARRFRGWIVLGIGAVFLTGGIVLSNTTAFLIAAVASGIMVYLVWRLPTASGGFDPIYGNARPATREEIAAAGFLAFHDPSTNTVIRPPAGIPLGTAL